jgi:hypothetical protein
MPLLLIQVNSLFLLDLLDARAPLIAVRNLPTLYLPTATCVNNGLANRDDRVLNYLLKVSVVQIMKTDQASALLKLAFSIINIETNFRNN